MMMVMPAVAGPCIKFHTYCEGYVINPIINFRCGYCGWRCAAYYPAVIYSVWLLIACVHAMHNCNIGEETPEMQSCAEAEVNALGGVVLISG